MEAQLQTIAFGNDNLTLEMGGKIATCYILKNGYRVISRESADKVLGYDGKSKNWLFEFLMSVNRLTLVEPALLESLSQPVHFHRFSGDPNIRQGYEISIFLEACQTIVKVNNEGFLYLSELPFAKSAEDVLNHLKGVAIEGLIDYATGYDLFRRNHKEALVRQMLNMGAPRYPLWIKSFPDTFFETIFDSQGWRWEDLNENAAKAGDYINHLIFNRIDDTLMTELENTKPKMKYRKGNNAEQYLENPELKERVASVMALMKASSGNRAIFEQLLNKSYPKRRNLNAAPKQTAIDNKIAAPTELTAFDENLKKALKKI